MLGIRIRYLSVVFRIHEILVRIWIRGSAPLTNGSGKGSCSCRQRPFVAFHFLKVHLHHSKTSKTYGSGSGALLIRNQARVDPLLDTDPEVRKFNFC
jgi:hypothetical protein